MITFDRTDQSIFGRWWWTVDRWQLGAVALLMFLGTVLITAASPPVAERIGIQDTFYFVERHVMMLVPAIIIMIGVSLLSPRGVRRVALGVFLISVVLVYATLVVGVEIKGARRWIHVPGLSIQPSEFVKPAFAVVAAWLFSLSRTNPGFPGALVSMAGPPYTKLLWAVSMLSFLLWPVALLKLLQQKRTPAFVWLVLGFVLTVVASTLAQWYSSTEFIAGFKRYFQAYGLLFAFAALAFSWDDVRRWQKAIVVIALFQLPFALYERIVLVPNQLDCLVRLQLDQVDAVLTDNALAAGQAAQDPSVHLIGSPLTHEPYAVAMNLDDTDLVRRVNKVLDDYRGGGADSAWMKAYDRWLAHDLPGISGPPAPLYRD